MEGLAVVDGDDNGAGATVLFGQKRIGPKFSPDQAFKGATIQSVAWRIATGKRSPDDVEVDVFMSKGHVVALNNRSLTALSLVGKKPTNIKFRTPTENEKNRLRETSVLGEYAALYPDRQDK
jgi:hypothetical protein